MNPPECDTESQDLDVDAVITFPTRESETTAPHPSLLITLGRRYSDHPPVAPSGDDSNVIRSVLSTSLANSSSLSVGVRRIFGPRSRDNSRARSSPPLLQ